MSACFLKRFLPFALTLLVGLMLGSIGSFWLRFDTPDGGNFPASSSHSEAGRPVALSGERTWTVIHSLPTPEYTGAEDYGYLTIRVRVWLDASGHVTNATVLSDLPGPLASDALRAAWNIRFTPATLNGQPVSVSTVVQYIFADRGFRESMYPIDQSTTVSEAGEDWHIVYE
jgi:TonB family protein